jgi:hypothetical protein
VFKVSSLASGEVSVVFHVPSSDADVALGLHHLRDKPVTVEIEEGWDGP